MTERPAETPSGLPLARLIRRILRAVGVVLAVFVALVAGAALFADSAPGHRLLVRALDGFRLANGLGVRLGAIDGSIYGRMTLRDVVVRDLRGPLLRSPRVTLAWNPLGLLSKHVQLQELTAGTVDVLRKPVLNAAPARTNKPLLPAISITLKRLSISDLTLEPTLAGARQRLAVSGEANLAGGRAKLMLEAGALTAASGSGGDQLHLDLDADPAKNRLVLQAHASGPADGLLASLAQVKAPVSLDLAGHGDWRLWQGRLDAAVGGRPLVGADLTEALGRLQARGAVFPGLLLSGPIARLADPSASFDIAGSMKNRVVSLNGRVTSPQMTVILGGDVGLADSTLRSMTISLQLPRPSLALARLTGSQLEAKLTASGPIAAPAFDYAVSAAAIGLGQDQLVGLKASGHAELGSGSHLRLSVQGSAGSLRAPGKLDRLIRDIRLDGDIAGQWTGAVKGRIALAANTLTATADVSGSTRTSTYSVLVSGRMAEPAVQALGLQPVLQGAAVFRADVERTPSATRIASLELTAPALRIASATGRLATDGAIALQASAVSTVYGPVGLTAGGTLKEPRVHLVAAHPKVGVQLTNLDANLSGSDGTFQLSARAGSPYGPVTADIALSLRAQTADVKSLAVAGLTLAGHLARTPRGPLSGRLTLRGDGLDGAILLSASGPMQAADLQLRARSARLPLAPAVLIASGAVSGHVVVSADGPSITARGRLSGVRRGSLLLTQAQADIDYHSAAGKAVVSAEGEAGAPFTLASTVSFTRGAIGLQARGSLNRLDFRLAEPARLVRSGSAWTLEPTVVVLAGGGRVDVSGAYGDGLSLQLGLQQVDLAMSQAFAPTLGLAGKASGSAELNIPAGGRMPRGRALVQLTGLTRSGEFTLSQPVDLSLLGAIGDTGAQASVAIRRQGAVIGRVQAQLTPSSAGNWVGRLRAGTVTGGLRYEGPAQALVGVAGVAGQELSGPIAIGVDWSGPLSAPQLRGLVRARNLAYENTKFGARIDDIAVDGSFSGTRFQLASFTGKAGRGTVAASGFVDLSLAAGLPVDVRATFDHAQLARSSDLSAAVSGAVRVTNGPRTGGLISGDLILDSARYAAAMNGAAKVPELTGVHRAGAPLRPPDQQPALPISRWKLDVRVQAPNQVFVTGMGLDSEWRADLRITGDVNHPVAVGDINLIRGTFSFAGRQLQLTDGRIHLNGASPPDPTLAVSASADVGDVTAMINIGGTAQDPRISFSSTPALPEDEVLSNLLFGASTPQLSPIQAIQLAASLNALRGGGHGLDVLARLRQAIGVQDLTLSAGAAGQGPELGVGKYIGNKIYVQVTADARGLAATEVQIALTKALSLITQIGALGDSNLSLRYSHRY